MTQDYELSLDKFQGPLDKLLELIEGKKLEITEISLAKVTDDFLAYLEKVSEVSAALLADFLVVASRLVLIKSKSLLPEFPLTQDEEADIKDLERRLRIYKGLKSGEKHIDKLWKKGFHAYSRPYFMHISSTPPVFYPASNVTLETMLEAVRLIHGSLQKFVLETETVESTIISLEEKMAEISRRMHEVEQTTMHALSSTKSRSEMIAIFLAVLHLAREQLIVLEQIGQFSDIIIKRKSNSDILE
ncbi:MAG: ScpA family protein [Patescibacteria group bacterium]